MAGEFWLSERQQTAIGPLLPKNQSGAHRVDDDWRVICAMIHVLKVGCQQDCSAMGAAGVQRPAPFVLDGPINADWFVAYVEQVSAPTLRSGDVVVMDKFSSHKGRPVRQAIRKAGAHLIFLLPYSPNLNPIEQVIAKLKTLLRKVIERTVDATRLKIRSLLDHFPPDKCANYLVNAEYAPTQSIGSEI